MQSKSGSPERKKSRRQGSKEDRSATDMLRAAGGDRKSKKERDMAQGSLQVTTKDLQASMDGVDTAILNFDVKTYIEEAVDQRCLPILGTVKKYDHEMQDWKKAYAKFRLTYDQDRDNLKMMI